MQPDSENNSSFHFKEVLSPNEPTPQNPFVEAYVAPVEAARCGSLIKEISRELPIGQLSHLKRVRRREVGGNESKGGGQEVVEDSGCAAVASSKKRRKTSAFSLEVLLGSCASLDEVVSGNDEQQPGTDVLLARKYNVDKVFRQNVPGRHPESRTEWERFNAVWPTVFYPMKTMEHKAKQLELTSMEKQQMTRGILAAVEDSKVSGCPGAVVVSSKDNRVLSRANDERKQQHQSISKNPLATSILLAIQGISRTEREMAVKRGMDSAEFKAGQYLCTACDLYSTQEPSVFEAMALVHSRIRRVVFLDGSPSWVRGFTDKNVHNLPGTNHKFRVFVCQRERVSAKTQWN